MKPPPKSHSTPVGEYARLGEALKLVELLDRYLVLRGGNLTSYPEAFQSITGGKGFTHDAPKPDVPVSLQHFPEVALSEHLLEWEREKQEIRDLTAAIESLCLEADVVALAKSQLVTEYSRLQPDVDLESFQVQGISKMLAILRAEEKRMVASVTDTISIKVVTAVSSDGKVSSIESVELPKHASWIELQDKLTKATTTWQAKEAGYPRGYSLKHGKWLYQLCKVSAPEKQMYDLATAQHYHEMRSKMDKMGGTVLVWHEQVLKASQEAKVRAAEEEKMWEQSQPRHEDGTPMFGPLDPNDLPELMRNEHNNEAHGS